MLPSPFARLRPALMLDLHRNCRPDSRSTFRGSSAPLEPASSRTRLLFQERDIGAKAFRGDSPSAALRDRRQAASADLLEDDGSTQAQQAHGVADLVEL